MKKTYHCLLVAAISVLSIVLIPTFLVAVQNEQNETEQEDPTQGFEEWQRLEVQPMIAVMENALLGNPTNTDQSFELTPDFLKGGEGFTYVPFSVTFDREALGFSPLEPEMVAVYLFVTEHLENSGQPEIVADVAEEEQQVDPLASVEIPKAVFEDVYFIDISGQTAIPSGQLLDRISISRAFTVPGGEYDVYVAIRKSKGELTSPDEVPPNEVPPTVLLFSQQVSVPGLWTTELRASSVIVAADLSVLALPLDAEEQIENPYTLGTTQIIPKIGREFSKAEELSVVLLVYNAQLTSEQAPDVIVEYNFYQKTNDGEEFFNKTNPQEFNKQTLPGFDASLGHQIVSGQAVPMRVFPIGVHRLEITVNDNAAGTSLIREVNFIVQE